MEALIGTDEAAAMLGVTARTLYRFVNAGDLPAYRIGRLVKFRPEEVEAFIEASRIDPRTPGALSPGGGAP